MKGSHWGSGFAQAGRLAGGGHQMHRTRRKEARCSSGCSARAPWGNFCSPCEVPGQTSQPWTSVRHGQPHGAVHIGSPPAPLSNAVCLGCSIAP
jgi:hypothetical protein